MRQLKLCIVSHFLPQALDSVPWKQVLCHCPPARRPQGGGAKRAACIVDLHGARGTLDGHVHEVAREWYCPQPQLAQQGPQTAMTVVKASTAGFVLPQPFIVFYREETPSQIIGLFHHPHRAAAARQPRGRVRATPAPATTTRGRIFFCSSSSFIACLFLLATKKEARARSVQLPLPQQGSLFMLRTTSPVLQLGMASAIAP